MIISKEIPQDGVMLMQSTTGRPDLPTYSITVTTAYFCNKSASETEFVSLYLAKKGKQAEDEDCILRDAEIPPTNTLCFGEEIALEDGDFLFAKSMSGNLKATMSVKYSTK